MLTRSYMEFIGFVDSLVQKAQGQKKTTHPAQLVRSSLIGLFEGVLRDQVLHERYGYPADYSAAQVEDFVGEVVDRLFESPA